MTVRFVDPRMLASVAAVFMSTCTIKRDVTGYNALREKLHDWQTLEAHSDLACAIGVWAERYTEQVTMTPITTTYDVLLAGYYPAIAGGMRAVVDNKHYDIVNVQHDLTKTVTQLSVTETEVV